MSFWICLSLKNVPKIYRAFHQRQYPCAQIDKERQFYGLLLEFIIGFSDNAKLVSQ